MFEDRAKRFVEDINFEMIGNFDERKFLYKLQDEISLFRKNKDKISYLYNIDLEVKKTKEEHDKECRNEPGTCHVSKSWEKCLFFVKQELDEIVDENLNEAYFTGHNDGFSNIELEKLHRKIDTVLDRLNELGYGQEVIFNEIDELKESSKKISKKDFNLLLLGKLVAFGEKALFGEMTIQELFEMAGNKFSKLIN